MSAEDSLQVAKRLYKDHTPDKCMGCGSAAIKATQLSEWFVRGIITEEEVKSEYDKFFESCVFGLVVPIANQPDCGQGYDFGDFERIEPASAEVRQTALEALGLSD